MKTFMESFLLELERESEGTRKLLALVPAGKADFKPHPKSMALKALTMHLADIPRWISLAIHTNELNFMTDSYKQPDCNNGAELVQCHDENVNQALNDLKTASDTILDQTWLLKSGDTVFMELTKMDTIRHSFGQLIHHRAQLGVYLRLLDIPIPGVYGPSADEIQH